MCRLFIAAAILLTAISASAGDDRSLAYGKSLVERNCSRCHAVALTDESTHPAAPPLRNLSQRYPIDALAEAFVEGISTGHPDMPEFILETEQTDAIITYIESLDP